MPLVWEWMSQTADAKAGQELVKYKIPHTFWCLVQDVFILIFFIPFSRWLLVARHCLCRLKQKVVSTELLLTTWKWSFKRAKCYCCIALILQTEKSSLNANLGKLVQTPMWASPQWWSGLQRFYYFCNSQYNVLWHSHLSFYFRPQ